MAEAAASCLVQEDATEIETKDATEIETKDVGQDVDGAVQAGIPVPVLDLKDSDESVSETLPPVEKPVEEKPSSQEVRPGSALSDKSTLSETSTPRDGDTSSGSPSPIPDDSPEGSARPKVCLGRDISLMMQALNSLHSPEEKIAALCKKYADLLEQHKMKEKQLRVTQRKHLQFVKDREQLQTDLNKALFGKSKMESLARELNKDNKRLKEQLYNDAIKMDKEKERVSAKFQAATDEISGKINSISDRNVVLHEENKSLAAKIAKHVEETVAREQSVKTILEHRDLKEQILTLELKKMEDEKNLCVGRHKELMLEAEKLRCLCEAFVKQEKEMKSQIEYYSEKFEDFQSTLDKSNQIFASFRTEMDRMTKKIKELEKGTAMWKKKWEDNEVVVKRVVGEKAEQDRFVDQLKEKLARLTTLCRALQAERNELSKKLARYEKKDKPAVETKAKNSDKNRKLMTQNSDTPTTNGLDSQDPETSPLESTELPQPDVISSATEQDEKPLSQDGDCPNASDASFETTPPNNDEAMLTAEQPSKTSQSADGDPHPQDIACPAANDTSSSQTPNGTTENDVPVESTAFSTDEQNQGDGATPSDVVQKSGVLEDPLVREVPSEPHCNTVQEIPKSGCGAAQDNMESDGK